MDAISDDLLQHVLGGLGALDLARCGQCCARLRRIAGADALWMPIVLTDHTMRADWCAAATEGGLPPLSLRQAYCARALLLALRDAISGVEDIVARKKRRYNSSRYHNNLLRGHLRSISRSEETLAELRHRQQASESAPAAASSWNLKGTERTSATSDADIQTLSRSIDRERASVAIYSSQAAASKRELAALAREASELDRAADTTRAHAYDAAHKLGLGLVALGITSITSLSGASAFASEFDRASTLHGMMTACTLGGVRALFAIFLTDPTPGTPRSEVGPSAGPSADDKDGIASRVPGRR